MTIQATPYLVSAEQTLGALEEQIARLEKEKEATWIIIFREFALMNTDRVVLPNGMSLARVLQHRSTYNENVARSILPSSEWPRITKRVIDPATYELELQSGQIAPEQDAQIRSVKESWVKRHESATKQELRELKGAE